MKVIQLYKSESALIKQATKNNRDAQHKLYSMFAPKMLSVCRYYISDLYQAEEAMLNGFFKVFNNLKSYRAEGSFEGWIRRIMVRESISYLRQRKPLEFPLEEVDVKSEHGNNINTNIEVAQIQELIDELPEGYRAVFVLYAIEGYKHNEISEMLGISEGTSKSQLFKARKVLQEKLKQINKTSSYGTT